MFLILFPFILFLSTVEQLMKYMTGKAPFWKLFWYVSERWHGRNLHIFKAARFNIDSKRIPENQKKLPKGIHRILLLKLWKFTTKCSEDLQYEEAATGGAL